MSRVAELADRPEGGRPHIAIPFKNMVTLDQIIGEAFGVGVSSKKVQGEYKNMIEKLGSEFSILMDASKSDIERATLPEIAEGIMRVREGKLHIEPGYDGEYGIVKIFKEGERGVLSKQSSLF